MLTEASTFSFKKKLKKVWWFKKKVYLCSVIIADMKTETGLTVINNKGRIEVYTATELKISSDKKVINKLYKLFTI